MVENDQGKFTILVGLIAKPLGLSTRGEAIEQARIHEQTAGGVMVKLLEQTDYGAVSIPFKGSEKMIRKDR